MSLAVKYRPSTLSEVVGHDIAIAVIKGAVLKKQASSFVLSGTRGSGKTTLARLIGKELNNGSDNFDLLEVDAASYSKVETIREEIIPYANTYPVYSDHKVVIIDECHALSKAAWQALLKPIEEPVHDRVTWVFCTTESHKVPETIISRSKNIVLKPVPADLIFKRLQFICAAENISYEDKALKDISYEASGSVREAISMLESCSCAFPVVDASAVSKVVGTVSADLICSFFESIVTGDRSSMVAILDSVYDLPVFFSSCLRFATDAVAQYYSSGSCCVSDMVELQSILKKMYVFQVRMLSSHYDVTVIIRTFFLTLFSESSSRKSDVSQEPVKKLLTADFVKTLGMVRVFD